MRTKRWFALFFAAALAASVLAGCQWPPDGGEDGSSSSSSSSSRPSSDDDDDDDSGEAKPVTYTVTARVEGTGGSAAASTSTVQEGGSVTVTITPDDYYVIGTVTDNGSDVTKQVTEENTYTLTNVQENHTIVITFTPTINPTDPSTWTVTEAGVIIVPAGADSDLIDYTLFDRYYLNATGLDLTGSGVTTIDDSAFYGCTSLQTVNLGGVTSIGAGAFQSCTNLTNVDMGSVTSIGHSAFEACTSLTNVDMSSVTSIGGFAFFQCSSLAHIRLGSVLPTTVLSGTFSGAGSSASTITIYSDELTDDQKEDVKKWFDANITVNFSFSSEYPGAAAGNALAQYLTRLF